jgi:peptidoglycan/LPS O-acetylase OafA/YrhL
VSAPETAPAAAPPPATARVGAIDGLRAVSALAVFVFHLTWRSPILHDAVVEWSGHLDTGVEVFFLMSGFLVFGPFAKAVLTGRSQPALGSYALKRAVRVWPGYLVVLTTIIVFGPSDLHGVKGLAKHVSLTYLYFHDRGGKGLALAWTLVVQLTFYALVPAFALVMAWIGRRVVAGSVALIVLGGYMQWYVALHLDTYLWVRILPPALYTLAMGMLFAAVRQQGDEPGRVGRALQWAAARPALPLAVAAAAFVTLVWAVPAGLDVGTRGGERALNELLQGLIAGGVCLPVVLAPADGTWWTRLLSNRTLAYIGTISYGFYLWHIPVLAWIRPMVVSRYPPTAVAGWVLGLSLALALAAASWHLVEKPLIGALGRRLSGPRTPGPVTPSQ